MKFSMQPMCKMQLADHVALYGYIKLFIFCLSTEFIQFWSCVIVQAQRHLASTFTLAGYSLLRKAEL